MKRSQYFVFAILLLLDFGRINAQEVNPHDFGKMWTFENPPKEWFLENYNFKASDAWFDHLQKSTLFFG